MPSHDQSTSETLLQRLRQPNQAAAWERFVGLYTPLLLYWARRSGLQAQDADDFVQEVLVLLLQKLPEFHYDQHKSFRSWLRTLALNRWRDRQRRQQPWAMPERNCPKPPARTDWPSYWKKSIGATWCGVPWS
jgi:RNA polymerase sigma-70 factor (ECF subfamily)